MQAWLFITEFKIIYSRPYPNKKPSSKHDLPGSIPDSGSFRGRCRICWGRYRSRSSTGWSTLSGRSSSSNIPTRFDKTLSNCKKKKFYWKCHSKVSLRSLPISQLNVFLSFLEFAFKILKNVIEFSLDWKCPEKCVKNGSCIEIGFRLGSRLRQIVIFTGKTKYHRNEEGKQETLRKWDIYFYCQVLKTVVFNLF